jgi:SAM-dependent methyltransferase
VSTALDNEPALARQAVVKIAEQSVDPAFRVAPRNPAFAHWDRSQLVDAYWQHHPRFLFLKTVPYAAKLLDIGAGDGGMSFWRAYKRPDRSDIAMYGIDMRQGKHFDQYHAYQVCNLDIDQIGFDDVFFDAAIASHVLEHLQAPSKLLQDLYGRLRAGAHAYIEIPSEHTKRLPTQPEYASRDWPMIIANFHDDCTHVDTMTLPQLADVCGAAGFQIKASGYVFNDYLSDAMIRYGIEHGDGEMLLYGYWSQTRWAQYVLLEKP